MNEPLSVPVNKSNVSPSCNAGPRFTTVNVPLSGIAAATSTSEVCALVRLISITVTAAASSARVLLSVNVPMPERPGAMLPPAVTVTEPTLVPTPPNAPVALTVTGPVQYAIRFDRAAVDDNAATGVIG